MLIIAFNYYTNINLCFILSPQLITIPSIMAVISGVNNSEFVRSMDLIIEIKKWLAAIQPNYLLFNAEEVNNAHT